MRKRHGRRIYQLGASRVGYCRAVKIELQRKVLLRRAGR